MWLWRKWQYQTGIIVTRYVAHVVVFVPSYILIAVGVTNQNEFSKVGSLEGRKGAGERLFVKGGHAVVFRYHLMEVIDGTNWIWENVVVVSNRGEILCEDKMRKKKQSLVDSCSSTKYFVVDRVCDETKRQNDCFHSHRRTCCCSSSRSRKGREKNRIQWCCVVVSCITGEEDKQSAPRWGWVKAGTRKSFSPLSTVVIVNAFTEEWIQHY